MQHETLTKLSDCQIGKKNDPSPEEWKIHPHAVPVMYAMNVC
ncbi:hypothetical protein HMPREF3038_00279 [Akkermansia sp. KLE1797]|nr:hypothetical protein HMPREF3038_00279 [Akkermansia sp. KLE1797]KXU54971.1 hypothetical protein HMPREF3039_00852 [Akkermansia sp. KLE1798]KZA04399.1 hypothetical protein HMPREF1326_01909 [Akkermansia sp. KLE1605]